MMLAVHDHYPVFRYTAFPTLQLTINLCRPVSIVTQHGGRHRNKCRRVFRYGFRRIEAFRILLRDRVGANVAGDEFRVRHQC